MIDWLTKLIITLGKVETKIKKTKRHKLNKLCSDQQQVKDVVDRFHSHFDFYVFRSELQKYCDNISPDIENIANLVSVSSTLDNSNVSSEAEINNDSISDDTRNLDNDSRNEFENENNSRNSCEMDIETNRLKGKFVSSNVINLSKRELSEAEISLLSKGLKYVPTPTSVNRAQLKEELESFGRRLRLLWLFAMKKILFVRIPFEKNQPLTRKGKMQL